MRGAAERDKPNAQRFREFTDSALPRIEQQLGAAVPVYPELEELRLGNSLERMREWLGPDHPVVRKLLSKESPAALAKRLVTETKLADPAVRLELWKGGSAAIAASTDPMIVLARSVDPDARAVRKAYEDGVEAPVRSATERIAKARFAALGTSVYPDATFTLRLNYGTVQGWNENGKPVEPFTRLSRAFERATGSDPFLHSGKLAAREGQARHEHAVQPVHQQRHRRRQFRQPADQRQGRRSSDCMFDGNIHSISGAYWFDTEKNRAIAVHPAIMREAHVEGLCGGRVAGGTDEVMGHPHFLAKGTHLDECRATAQCRRELASRPR